MLPLSNPLLKPTLASLALLTVVGCSTTTSSKAPPPSTKASATEAPAAAPAAVAITVAGGKTEVDDAVTPDPDMQAMLSPYAQQVNARAKRVVGQIDGPMKRGKPESAMGNFVTDAMRSGMKDLAGSEVDACFTNAGGLRVDFDAGDVTEGMVVELMPFENAVVILSLDGKRLRKIMERLAQRGDPVSGIRYKRVRDGGYQATDVVIGGQPLDDNKTYTLCTNDYVYEGGGRYHMEDIQDVRNTGILIRDVILHAFEKAHKGGAVIHPSVEGRVEEAS